MFKEISFAPQTDKTKYSVVLILAPSSNNKTNIEKYYVDPLVAQGFRKSDILVLIAPETKPTATVAREHFAKLNKLLNHFKVQYVIFNQAPYFKPITKCTKVTQAFGTPFLLDGFNNLNAFYIPNFTTALYDIALSDRIDWCIKKIAEFHAGTNTNQSLTEFFAFQTADHPKILNHFRQFDVLTLDLETSKLCPYRGGIMSAAIASSKYEGAALFFPNGNHFPAVYRHFKDFLINWVTSGKKFIYHNAPFDIKFLIRNFFMKDADDYRGMVEGLHLLFEAMDDTQTLTYLATNSCIGNKLSLKEQSLEFMGNYGLQDDVKDMRKVFGESVKRGLKYNLDDARATWYVYEKYRDIVRNEQESVYQNVFKPSLKTITQMELCGLPMNISKVHSAEIELTNEVNQARKVIDSSPLIAQSMDLIRQSKADKDNLKLKKITRLATDFDYLEFNLDSPDQLKVLLYEVMDLPVFVKTDKGAPSTGGKALSGLMEYVKQRKLPDEYMDVLKALQQYNESAKILGTFIPAFKNAVHRKEWRYLTGSFKLGGTKSGRLSSSDPNLQNIPSTGTRFAKIIKKCFACPPTNSRFGRLFVGADYFSLEDRISALQTKDPEKLKVYEEGYDGHCLRAYAYFSDQMVDITLKLKKATQAQRVVIVNSIAQLYAELRQLSKGPTFALTYMGTWKTLVQNFGLTEAEAKQIEENYHKLYHVSDAWVEDQIKKASQTGYVELAFGLRLRTPLLKQVLYGTQTVPYNAVQEKKTAANALGQSYGLLNSYSANLFMERVWASKWSHKILPCAQIHDSQYYEIENSIECLKWTNDNLIECMEWNELPEIQHPTVKLGAELEVYLPDWSNPVVIPPRSSVNQIKEVLKNYR